MMNKLVAVSFCRWPQLTTEIMKRKKESRSIVTTQQTQLARVQSSLVRRGLEQIEGTERSTQIGVLVVNDFDETRKHICNLVDSFKGIQVVGEAKTGLEAIHQYVSLRPDVVCMNVTMPEMDGIEATRIIVAQHPDARVFMLTVRSGPEIMNAAQLAGALGYMVLPPHVEELESTIRRLAIHAAT